MSTLSAQRDQFIEMLRQESADLLKLEQEISYYRDLVLKKESIKNLYRENNLALIKQNLTEDLARLEALLRGDDIDAARLLMGELKLVYNEIPELSDQMLYYQAKLAEKRNNPRKARVYLEKILAEQPQSEIMNLVVKLLGKNYFFLGDFQKLLDIYQQHPQWIDLDVAYQLAQANYNLNKLETAKQLFSSLVSSEDYGLRAKMMLGLITYQLEGAETALQNFVKLRGETDPKSEYYDFIILTLARIYTELQDQPRALAHYDLYDELNNVYISPEILFEMGNVNLNAEDLEQAIFYFNEISQKFPESEYYVSAKFQLAMAEQSKDDFSLVENNFQELLARNELVTTALNQKYSLLESYRKTVADLYSQEHPEAQEQELRAKVANLDASLIKTNKIIRDLYGSLDKQSQYLLEVLEEEYKSYVSTLQNIDAVTTLAQNAKSGRIEDNIQTSIAYSDSTELVLEMMRLVGHKTTFTEDEYLAVKNIARERLDEKKQLREWNDLEIMARTEDNSLLLRQVNTYQRIVEDDLRTLDIVAQTVLGGAPPAEMLAMIEDELESINRNREDLHSLKNEVAENFNQRIVEKLSGRKQTMEQEFNEINQLYSTAFSDLEAQIKSQREDYEITYLDLLFKQTQIADQEYNKYQEKIRNEQ
jgi:tetratricopeptide (TPR) repeat protein